MRQRSGSGDRNFGLLQNMRAHCIICSALILGVHLHGRVELHGQFVLVVLLLRPDLHAGLLNEAERDRANIIQALDRVCHLHFCLFESI